MTNVSRAKAGSPGFSLLEMLVSAVVLALILVALLGVLNIVSASYKRTSGKLDSFDSARTAFGALTRVVQQATLLSHLGYDDPTTPTDYQLKSDLHFLSGPQEDLGLSNTEATATHAIFFQAPLGIASDAALQNSNLLLNATGFFIAYGDDPMRPPILEVEDKTENRRRYRLFQFFQPREDMTVYDYTITPAAGIPVSNDAFMGSDWFLADVQARKFCHPLAENVIALFILPVVDGEPAVSYLWNSRDAGTAYSHHRLPQALKVVMAVIDERSAARLGNTVAAPALLPDALFEETTNFDSDLDKLDLALSGFDPPLNYRIFTAEIPLNPSNTNL